MMQPTPSDVSPTAPARVQTVFAGHLGQQHLKVFLGEKVSPIHANAPHSLSPAVRVCNNCLAALIDLFGKLPKLLSTAAVRGGDPRSCPVSVVRLCFRHQPLKVQACHRIVSYAEIAARFRRASSRHRFQQCLGHKQPRLDCFDGNAITTGQSWLDFPAIQ